MYPAQVFELRAQKMVHIPLLEFDIQMLEEVGTVIFLQGNYPPICPIGGARCE
jgi:hypothetical protein